MRRIIMSIAATLALAAAGAGTALATKKPPHPSTAANGKKVWICHRRTRRNNRTWRSGFPGNNS